jgi:hypothetical protein
MGKGLADLNKLVGRKCHKRKDCFADLDDIDGLFGKCNLKKSMKRATKCLRHVHSRRRKEKCDPEPCDEVLEVVEQQDPFPEPVA